MGLTSEDMEVLRHYARHGNRELYWNYLAQRPGNDGYGLLALGVVRNDNAPGATANAYAAATAHAVNHRDPTERDWEMFGRDLLKEDFARRLKWMRNGDARAALNLPVDDIQGAHDAAFHHMRIADDAWTPRQILEAARRQGGTAEAEKVWHMMLDNSHAGLDRFIGTTVSLAWRYNDEHLDALAYVGRLGQARGIAALSRPNTDPDLIGTDNFHYRRVRDGWVSVTERDGGMPVIERITDLRTLRELDDIRALRLERQQLRTQFHPADPARVQGIARSPALIADADAPPVPHASPAAAHANEAATPLDPGIRERLTQMETQVQALAERTGANWDASQIRRLSLGLATMCAADPLMRRVGEVAASAATAQAPAGARLFAIHRPFGAHEPTFHVALDVQTALRVPDSAGLDALARHVAATPTPALAETAVQREVATVRHPVHAL